MADNDFRTIHFVKKLIHSFNQIIPNKNKNWEFMDNALNSRGVYIKAV